jgi:3-oxoacyl-[acyl-carrier protein] reductase
MSEAAMRPFDLSGKVAVVTGAGSETGIGYATATMLAELGAAVLISATTARVHDRVAGLRAAGHDAAGVVADLTHPRQATQLIAAATQRWNRVDVLVNNAGMTSQADPSPEHGLIDDLSLASWHAGMARNLDTAFLVTQAALPVMTEPGGRIVMISSITGPVMAMRGDVVYAAAKAGMVGLARALALDVAERGITVNVVAPGWIATGSQTPHEYEQGLRTPLGRSATAAEVAAAAVFLAIPGASYITGQTIVVDGGNSIAEERA